MVREYEMQATSSQSAKVSEVVLRETGRTRLVARAEIVDNQKSPDAGVRLHLVHQVRPESGAWEDLSAESLGKLKAGEGYRLHLNAAATLNLQQALTDFYAISNSGGVRRLHKVNRRRGG